MTMTMMVASDPATRFTVLRQYNVALNEFIWQVFDISGVEWKVEEIVIVVVVILVTVMMSKISFPFGVRVRISCAFYKIHGAAAIN